MPRVLLIEDEPLILNSLKRLLMFEGAAVDATLSGKDAIRLLAVNKYDKVVCDLMLKDITGFDILEEATKYYSRQAISAMFIIITAYSSENVLAKARKYGCTILTKPFEDLHYAIQLILQ